MRPSRIQRLAIVTAQSADAATTVAMRAADCAGRQVVVPLATAGPTTGPDDLERRLDAALGTGPRALVLDMTAVGRLSSTTIGALLSARRRCSARGIDILLRHPSRQCRETLERTGLLGFLLIEPAADGHGRAAFTRRS